MQMTEYKRDPVREFLESAKEAKLEIARHRERVEELESRATKVTASLNAMPGGGNSDAQQLWIALAEERDREREAEKRELEKYRAVESFIDRLPDKMHRMILRLRYLRLLKWVPIQMELYKKGVVYCERELYRIHGEALDVARELWRKRGGENEVPAESTSEVLH